MEVNSDLKFQQRKLLKELQTCSGSHTSLVSVALRPSDSLIQMSQMLQNELATASNIKSRVNRHSVEDALNMALFQLSTWKSTPSNGLLVYCGNCTLGEKDVQKSLSFEPFRAVGKKMYRCDSQFHTDGFEKLFESDTAYGFIIVDGNGYLLSILKGDEITHLEKYEANLPKKHNKGGQSALRFARLRMESRANYIRKVAEACNKHFICNNVVRVKNIILAGNAEFKQILAESEILDKRIRASIIKILDVAYGDKRGLYEAIQQSKTFLADMPYMEEKEQLTRFFNLVANETDLTCYGVETVIKALFEMQIVAELFIYGDSDIKAPNGQNLVDFMIETHMQSSNTNDVKLHIITNNTAEAQQLIKGFNGIGGILRYKYDLTELEETNMDSPYALEESENYV
jgi:peptide chain release factor subunit 1